MKREYLQQLFYNAFKEHCYYTNRYSYLIDRHTVEQWEEFTIHSLTVNFFESLEQVAQYRFTVTIHKADKWSSVQLVSMVANNVITGTQLESFIKAVNDVRKVVNYEIKING